jgi:chromosome segregation ATPase
MAKQVNVPINYRVNTIEVDQAKTRVEQAQRATDNLRTATQQFTSTASQGFKAASRTVEGMEIELARLRQQIKLTDTTDKQRYTTLMAQYKNLQSQVQAYNKELSNTQKVAKQTAQSHRELGNNMRDVYTAAKLLITAGVARELVNISLEASKLAGNIEGVSTAFRNQVPAAESVLNRLRDATKGTVTDLELMQKRYWQRTSEYHLRHYLAYLNSQPSGRSKPARVLTI